MKFVFFSVSENGENGLGDDEADGAMSLSQNFGATTAPDSCRRTSYPESMGCIGRLQVLNLSNNNAL